MRGRLGRSAAAFLDLSRVERRFFVGAWLLAPWASLSVRRWGFRRALELAARSARRRDRPSDDGITIDVERAEGLVKRAFRRSFADPTCLPEAIVQYVLHQRFGPPPKLLIGVRLDAPRPAPSHDGMAFGAHAWVERDGGPRREPAFAPILELTARGVSQTPEAST